MTYIAHESRVKLREATLAWIPVGLVLAFGVGWLFVRPDFFWQDDLQTQYLPASREIADALSAGELPILSKLCWYGGALAGEYQHGVFSISTLLLNWLVWKLGMTLQHTAAALVLSHLAILAAGAFRLARSRGLGLQEATLVALIASLNGWIVGWGPAWYPSLTSFAWVPWAWWALERALAVRSAASTLLAGFFLYLLLAAGWPYAVLGMALLSACLLVRATLARRHPLAGWPLGAAWLAGLGLAAPALLMLVEYGSVTQRVAQTELVFPRQWLVPLEGLFGLILPAFHTWWREYDADWSARSSMELAGGLLPWCAAAYAVGARGIRPLWSFDALIALLAMLFAILPGIASISVSFRWLPLMHLAFALTGASCLQTSRATHENTHLRVALVAAGSVMLTLLLSTGSNLDPTTITVQLGKVLLALTVIWAACERFVPRLLAGWGPVALCLASLVATYTFLHPVGEPPRWTMDERLRDAAPLEPQRRYLSLFDFTDMIHNEKDEDGRTYRAGAATSLRLGYTAMYANLQVVNGYSAMRPQGPATILHFHVHSEVNRWRSVEILRSETAEGGLLDLMGVDGLLLATFFQWEIPALEQNGWRRAGKVAEGLVLHRERAPTPRAHSVPSLEWLTDREQLVKRLTRNAIARAPILRLGGDGVERFATAELGEVHEERLSSRVHVSVPPGPEGALIVFARPWLPGWRATLNGERLKKVFAVDELMPAVRVPAGAEGELVLQYRPLSLRVGGWSMLVTSLLALGWWSWERQRARKA